MKRRSFLKGGAALGLMCAAGGGGWWFSRKITPEYLASILNSSFSTPSDLVMIGQLYLRDHAKEHDRSILGNRLAQRFSKIRAWQIEDALPEVIHEDFALDDVAVVDGWILSRTEVRLCALACLNA